MTNPLKVLCVDDELDILEVAKLALETVGGLEVETCSDSQKAVEALEKMRPDVLLLDMMMPGMDGLAVLAAVRQHSQFDTLPVILMTAKVQPDEVRHYLEMGATGVVPKPFDPMTLADEVRQIWSGK